MTGLYKEDGILPPPPEGAVRAMHNREYRVDSWFLSADRILVRGALRDQKPPGMFVPGDPEPLTMHHMVVSLEVRVEGLMIEAIDVEFISHPHPTCPSISTDYEQLVGVSIARGYNNRVRELLGGPRGCSHVTALLQAMGPVAFQSMKSVEIIMTEGSTETHPIFREHDPDVMHTRLRNTCHIWAEDSATYQIRKKEGRFIPSPIQERMDVLGIEQ